MNLHLLLALFRRKPRAAPKPAPVAPPPAEPAAPEMRPFVFTHVPLTRAPSARCVDFIKSFEGLHILRYDGLVEAYPDPKTGGAPWTIGWGTTGPDVKKGTVWTKAQCDARFEQSLREFTDGVNSLVKVPVTQGQFDALVSFAYNCGLDIDADDKAEGLGDSTLLRKLNAGDFAGAAAEFPKWISRGTPVEAGLRRRRKGEVEMFWS